MAITHPTEIIDEVIISDIHLGSRVSRAKELIDELKKLKFKRLILNGDVFDDLNFESLSEKHWEFLSYIRDLANSKDTTEVIWIRGNHDDLLKNVASHLLGINVYNEYAWERGGIRYLVIHGDQFDHFLVDYKILTSIVSSLYLLLQRMDTSQRISRYLKRRLKLWLKVSNQVAELATLYGKSKHADVVFCGHTHQPIHKELNGVRYYNSGCWTDIPSTYITIKGSEVKTHSKY